MDLGHLILVSGSVPSQVLVLLLWLSPIVEFRLYYIFIFDIGYSLLDISRLRISCAVHFFSYTFFSVWSILCSVSAENCIGRGGS